MSRFPSNSDASSTSEKRLCTADVDAPFQTALSQTPADPTDFLPSILRHDESDFTEIRVPRASDIPLILRKELGIRRMKAILHWHPFVDKTTPTRPLHWQKVIGREIFPMERLDMHLVYCKKKIFIKPLPRLLLDKHFWENYVRCDALCGVVTESLAWPVQGPEPKYCLRATALGFLVSYTALITHESDLKIAKELQLIPEEFTWLKWKPFLKEILAHPDILEKMEWRFRLGELHFFQLSRAWRFTNYYYGPSYMPSYDRHSSFLEDWFGILATIIAFIVVILTALQVGLATDVLGNSGMFQLASWLFCLFSIAAPLLCLGFVLFTWFTYYFFDLVENCLSEDQKKPTAQVEGTAEHMV